MTTTKGSVVGDPSPVVRDVVIGIGKVAANLGIGANNIGAMAVGGAPTQPYDSSSAVQEITTHALEVLTLVSPFLNQAGPASVMMAESKPAAIATANEAQQLPASVRPGAAGALTTRDGQTFTATTRGNASLEPRVQPALDSVPPGQRSLFHGRCCEPRLVSAALRAGADMRGASVSVVKVRGLGNPNHGASLSACSSCQSVLKFAGID